PAIEGHDASRCFCCLSVIHNSHLSHEPLRLSCWFDRYNPCGGGAGMNVVIIGAGVAGLGIGWRLLQQGCAVTILERFQPGTGASWAAAGMLAVTAELEDAAEPERALAMRASALWPGFAAELEEASGRAVFLASDGALLLAADTAELEVMAGRATNDLKLVGAEEARALVPLLGSAVGGLWSPREAHVDNRALAEALAIAVL